MVFYPFLSSKKLRDVNKTVESLKSGRTKSFLLVCFFIRLLSRVATSILFTFLFFFDKINKKIIERWKSFCMNNIIQYAHHIVCDNNANHDEHADLIHVPNGYIQQKKIAVQ